MTVELCHVKTGRRVTCFLFREVLQDVPNAASFFVRPDAIHFITSNITNNIYFASRESDYQAFSKVLVLFPNATDAVLFRLSWP